MDLQGRNSLCMCLYYTSTLLSEFIISEKGGREIAGGRGQENESGGETSPNLGTVDIEQNRFQHI